MMIGFGERHAWPGCSEWKHESSYRGSHPRDGRLALTGTSGELLANDPLQRVHMGLHEAAVPGANSDDLR